MHRRALLTGMSTIGVGGIAGCLGSLTNFSGADVHPVHLSVADVDTIADENELEMGVECLESTVTDSQPARLQVTTMNTGPERTVSVGAGGCGLFTRNAGGSNSPPGLWLYTKRRSSKLANRYEARDGDRWVEDKAKDNRRGYDGYGCTSPTYSPGEELTNEYVVWDDYRVSGYFEPGTYRWEETVTTIPPDSSDDDTGGTSFVWGFSLHVER